MKEGTPEATPARLGGRCFLFMPPEWALHPDSLPRVLASPKERIPLLPGATGRLATSLAARGGGAEKSPCRRAGASLHSRGLGGGPSALSALQPREPRGVSRLQAAVTRTLRNRF